MTQTISLIPLDQIIAGNNDRTVFNQSALEDLAASIAKVGLIQPITLNLWAPDPGACFGGDRFGPAAQYQIIAGERRYRASVIAGKTTIRAIVIEVTPAEASALMLAENTGRVDLDPIDEANAYKIRIDKLGWTVDECAKAAGTSAIKVQFRLKLLTLIPEIQHLVRSGNFPLGYAAILADASLDPNRQMLAFGNYRENHKPTLGWFRSIVNQYATQQNQSSMFSDEPLLKCQEMLIETKVIDPPHPSTTTPPVIGKKPLEIIRNQILFWQEAAKQWEGIGKPFKKQECEAAARSLDLAAISIYSK